MNDKLYRSIKKAEDLINIYCEDNNINKENRYFDQVDKITQLIWINEYHAAGIGNLIYPPTVNLYSLLAAVMNNQSDLNKLKETIENKYDIKINLSKIDFDRLYRSLLKNSKKARKIPNLEEMVENSSCYTIYDDKTKTYEVFTRTGINGINQRFNMGCALADIALSESDNFKIKSFCTLDNHFDSLKNFSTSSDEHDNCVVAYALTILIDPRWLEYKRYINNHLITEDMYNKRKEVEDFYNNYKQSRLLIKQKK